MFSPLKNYVETFDNIDKVSKSIRKGVSSNAHLFNKANQFSIHDLKKVYEQDLGKLAKKAIRSPENIMMMLQYGAVLLFIYSWYKKKPKNKNQEGGGEDQEGGGIKDMDNMSQGDLDNHILNLETEIKKLKSNPENNLLFKVRDNDNIELKQKELDLFNLKKEILNGKNDNTPEDQINILNNKLKKMKKDYNKLKIKQNQAEQKEKQSDEIRARNEFSSDFQIKKLQNIIGSENATEEERNAVENKIKELKSKPKTLYKTAEKIIDQQKDLWESEKNLWKSEKQKSREAKKRLENRKEKRLEQKWINILESIGWEMTNEGWYNTKEQSYHDEAPGWWDIMEALGYNTDDDVKILNFLNEVAENEFDIEYIKNKYNNISSPEEQYEVFKQDKKDLLQILKWFNEDDRLKVIFNDDVVKNIKSLINHLNDNDYKYKIFSEIYKKITAESYLNNKLNNNNDYKEKIKILDQIEQKFNNIREEIQKIQNKKNNTLQDDFNNDYEKFNEQVANKKKEIYTTDHKKILTDIGYENWWYQFWNPDSTKELEKKLAETKSFFEDIVRGNNQANNPNETVASATKIFNENLKIFNENLNKAEKEIQKLLRIRRNASNLWKVLIIIAIFGAIYLFISLSKYVIYPKTHKRDSTYKIPTVSELKHFYSKGLTNLSNYDEKNPKNEDVEKDNKIYAFKGKYNLWLIHNRVWNPWTWTWKEEYKLDQNKLKLNLKTDDDEKEININVIKIDAAVVDEDEKAKDWASLTRHGNRALAVITYLICLYVLYRFSLDYKKMAFDDVKNNPAYSNAFSRQGTNGEHLLEYSDENYSKLSSYKYITGSASVQEIYKTGSASVQEIVNAQEIVDAQEVKFIKNQLFYLAACAVIFILMFVWSPGPSDKEWWKPLFKRIHENETFYNDPLYRITFNKTDFDNKLSKASFDPSLKLYYDTKLIHTFDTDGGYKSVIMENIGQNRTVVDDNKITVTFTIPNAQVANNVDDSKFIVTHGKEIYTCKSSEKNNKEKGYTDLLFTANISTIIEDVSEADADWRPSGWRRFRTVGPRIKCNSEFYVPSEINKRYFGCLQYEGATMLPKDNKTIENKKYRPIYQYEWGPEAIGVNPGDYKADCSYRGCSRYKTALRYRGFDKGNQKKKNKPAGGLKYNTFSPLLPWEYRSSYGSPHANGTYWDFFRGQLYWKYIYGMKKAEIMTNKVKLQIVLDKGKDVILRIPKGTIVRNGEKNLKDIKIKLDRNNTDKPTNILRVGEFKL